jgi:hypothetical protein
VASIPFVLLKNRAMTFNGALVPLGPPSAMMTMKVGSLNATWNLEIPTVHLCTEENHCVDPGKPKPKPPAYWDLPAFCESWAESYNIFQCGVWQAQVMGNVSGKLPNGPEDVKNYLNSLLKSF